MLCTVYTLRAQGIVLLGLMILVNGLLSILSSVCDCYFCLKVYYPSVSVLPSVSICLSTTLSICLPIYLSISSLFYYQPNCIYIGQISLSHSLPTISSFPISSLLIHLSPFQPLSPRTPQQYALHSDQGHSRGLGVRGQLGNQLFSGKQTTQKSDYIF